MTLAREDAVFMQKSTVAAVFIRNTADGLDADAFAFAFGGQKYAVFFPDNPVKGIFHRQQQHMSGMETGSHFDLPS